MKYLLAYSIPLMTFLSIYFGNIYSFSTLAYAFMLVPAMELLLQQSGSKSTTNNYTSKNDNIWFDLLLYCNLPMVYLILLYAINKVATTTISTTELVGLIFSVGIMLGANGINVAHELGHRQKKYEKVLAKLLLLPSYYAHFYIEHNHGHHVNVATKNDASTAKYNQNLYKFWIQSVAGTYVKAWKIQLKLNKDNHRQFINLKNDMLWLTIFEIMAILTVYYYFGIAGTLFSLAAGTVGFLLLETINYIEHYGLERKKTLSGRYERVTEQHSWNSNHPLGRIILYELTRHSDHHAKSIKKYQTLENKPTSPQLPYGYPTSMLIALVPPLWFSIMNKRVPRV